MDFDGNYHLAYGRKEIISTSRNNREDFEITIFERSLKHLGFYVIQTTHQSTRDKIWKLMSDVEYTEFQDNKKFGDRDRRAFKRELAKPEDDVDN
jgi:hypothetical protein